MERRVKERQSLSYIASSHYLIKGGGLDAIDTSLQIPEPLRLVFIKPLTKSLRQGAV